MEALYFCLTKEGAEAELRAVIERQSIPVSRGLRIFEFDVELTRVADLTEDALASVSYATEALTGEVWGVPAHVGAAANWLELSGLLVPGARHAGANLVSYVNNFQPEDRLQLVGPAPDA